MNEQKNLEKAISQLSKQLNEISRNIKKIVDYCANKEAQIEQYHEDDCK